MSAVGHYLEQEGVATASVSLVREHSEVMRPPRALWVPFLLGRPLGAPDAPAFQRAVLLAVLRLFERRAGPVLEDFPHDAPDASQRADTDVPDACPLPLGAATSGDAPLADRLQREIAQLRPWHDLGVRRRGGSAMGASGLSPEAAAARVVSYADPARTPVPIDGRTPGDALKHAVDDLRTFYEEAFAAQPGAPSPADVQRWLYRESVAGEALHAARAACLSSGDPGLRAVAERALIPRAVLNAAPR